MHISEVFDRGVCIVADIHHSHGIKVALAVTQLRQRYPNWSEDFWKTALARAQWHKEPTAETLVSAPDLEFTPARAKLILARQVVPACYSAIRSWAKAVDAHEIIAMYLGQACADPEYLGHRLSVLLAFYEAWPVYRTHADRGLFLDRLAEFVIACHFSEEAEPAKIEEADWDRALSGGLSRPGYFGHHVICLASIGRNRALLGKAQFANAMSWVIRASAATHADPEDNVVMLPKEAVDSDPESALRELLTHGVPNIHLLTLADSIDWLWQNANDKCRPYLQALAERFTMSLQC